MRQVRPKKSLGQHFLIDLGIAQDIADTVDACASIPVLEVGPGMGVLTQFLQRKGRPLKVVELDRESIAYLHTNFPTLQGNIIEGDFLRMDLRNVFDGKPFVLTGNYPYNISSQIFFKMLDNKDLIPCCTGMIQKEVAERMAAGPGSKTYGTRACIQPSSQGKKRRNSHDAQRHPRTRVRRSTVQARGENHLQPTTEDVAQLNQALDRPRLPIAE